MFFIMSKMVCHLLPQKVCQRISVHIMKTNTLYVSGVCVHYCDSFANFLMMVYKLRIFLMNAIHTHKGRFHKGFFLNWISKNPETVARKENFFQRTNENKSTWGIIVVKSNSFVHFLEETSAWKNHFHYVWPLVTSIVCGLPSNF